MKVKAPATMVGAVCARHLTSTAVDVCTRCGSFVCSLCIELSKKDEVFCEPCFELVERADRPSRLAPIATVFLALGIGLIFFGNLLSLLFGIAGVVLAVIDWRRGSRVPKALLIIAPLFGALLLVAVAVMIWVRLQ